MGDTGIYKITNIANGKIYIGKASYYKSRKRSHESSLKRGVHPNVHLQRAWDKYGGDNFIINLIEECDRERLTIRENYWMNFYESFNYKKGYNQSLPSESNLSYRHSKKSRNMMSNSAIKYTDKELIDYLIYFYHENNKVPTQRDMTEKSGYVSGLTYRNRFGSFKNALILAGLYDLILDKRNFDRVKTTEEDKPEIIRTVQDFVKENRRFIEGKDIDNHQSLPSYSTINKLFDNSLKNLMHECGYTKEDFIEMENEIAIENLSKLYLQDGKKITKNTIENCSYTRSYSFYVKRFGKLSTAYKLAGILVDRRGYPIPANKISTELEKV